MVAIKQIDDDANVFWIFAAVFEDIFNLLKFNDHINLSHLIMANR